MPACAVLSIRACFAAFLTGLVLPLYGWWNLEECVADPPWLFFSLCLVLARYLSPFGSDSMLFTFPLATLG